MLNHFSLSFFGCSCVSIQTNKTRIICDPWFDTAAYEGTWVPDMDVSNWVNKIGNCDAIYVSHIHPDHYDAKSIFNYFKKYGEKKIFISSFKNLKGVDRNWLKKKMIADGIKPKLIISNLKGFHNLKDLNLIVIPRDTKSFSDIDSGIIVYHNQLKVSVTNLNDFGFNKTHFKNFQKKINENKLQNIATLYNYMSSGSWPHTHYKCDIGNKELNKSLEVQREEFRSRYFEAHNTINSKVHLPFAAGAKYLGPLKAYEKFRPKIKVKSILDKDKFAIYLKPFGKKIDLLKSIKDKKYFNSFRPKKINENLSKNKHIHSHYDYEKTFQNLTYNPRVLKTLFNNSKTRAMSRSEVKNPHLLCIYALPDWKNFNNLVFKNKLDNKQKYLIGNVEFNLKNLKSKKKIHRTEIYINHKALFGAFSGIVHWNNLELGAHKIVRRYPEIYNKGIVDFLNFFSIC